jgi:hypothetical protein
MVASLTLDPFQRSPLPWFPGSNCLKAEGKECHVFFN